MRELSIVWLCSVAFLAASPAQAQQKTPGDWAWKPLLKHKGVEFSYIFYSRADSRNNGVVIKLVNTNDVAVTYRFKVVFRATDAQVVEEVSGDLKAKETKTGDAAGLFWIPFTDGRAIGEVGLRGYKVNLKSGGRTPHAPF